MNKKQILKGILIFFTTLFSGFGITVISFNLFDTMTPAQMKILFTFDVLSLITIGAIVYLFNENKRLAKKKEEERAKRHNDRIAEMENEMKDFFKIIDNSNFAA